MAAKQRITVGPVDPAKFKTLPAGRTTVNHSNMEQAMLAMQSNLLILMDPDSKLDLDSMTREEKENTFGGSVADYEWSDQVKQDFYSWGFHAPLVKFLQKKRPMDWAMWGLDMEPADGPD
jgi:hypothetical protein